MRASFEVSRYGSGPTKAAPVSDDEGQPGRGRARSLSAIDTARLPGTAECFRGRLARWRPLRRKVSGAGAKSDERDGLIVISPSRRKQQPPEEVIQNDVSSVTFVTRRACTRPPRPSAGVVGQIPVVVLRAATTRQVARRWHRD